MNDILLDTLAHELYTALIHRQSVTPLTDRHPELSIEQAYSIQQRLNALRLANGHCAVGRKIGVTSAVVMSMLKVHQPDFGLLTDAMHHQDGAQILTSQFIQPKIETEIAFRLRRDLVGENLSTEDVLEATETVMTSFEVVDSRVRDWKIKIQDTVADNASCGVYVLGRTEVDPRQVDLLNCAMTMHKNGSVVATGKGSATMGSPLIAVAWLANTQNRLGAPLRAGEIILSGALGAMIPIQAGDSFHAQIEGLGTCSVRFN